MTATVDPLAPAFFTIGTNATSGNMYVAAEHVNGTLIGPAATIKAATPAEPGETIMLFATGFGATPATGEALTVTPIIVIDGIVADVTFAGLVGPGLYQFNVVVPSSVSLGQDVLVVGLANNFETQLNAYLTIASQYKLGRQFRVGRNARARCGPALAAAMVRLPLDVLASKPRSRDSFQHPPIRQGFA